MDYNERWSREKHIEYRNLKRFGYSHKQLKEHFGEDIDYSGMYNKNANILPWLGFINEIKIDPLEIPYHRWEANSLFYKNQTDYFTEFETDNGVKYILFLMYYIINDTPTYNVLFSTKDQFEEYERELKKILLKGSITDEDREYLMSIFEKETNYNDIYNIMRRISFIVIDIYNKKIKGAMLSIGETNNKVKIDLYRSIIKDSFRHVKEEEVLDDRQNKYYFYRIE